MPQRAGAARRVLQPADERFEAPQCARLDAVTDAWPIHVATDEPGLLQDLQVLRHGGLRERKLVHDVAANAARPPREKAKDLHASGMAERLGEHGQLLVGLGAFDGAQVRLIAGRGAAGLHGSRTHRDLTMTWC